MHKHKAPQDHQAASTNLATYAELNQWLLQQICEQSPSSEQTRGENGNDSEADTIKQLITPSNKLSSQARLNIYQRGYYARLLNCFKQEYLALNHYLGDELFKAFVTDYLQQHPSQSYTLSQLAAGFVQHLQQTLSAQLATKTQANDWQNLIIELAQIERACYEIYDGPGHEQQTTINANHLLQVPASRWPQTTIQISSSARVFQLTHSLADYVISLRQGKTPVKLNTPKQTSNTLLIYRQHYQLRLLNMSSSDYPWLNALITNPKRRLTISELMTTVSADDSMTATPVKKLATPTSNASQQTLRNRLLHYADLSLFINTDNER